MPKISVSKGIYDRVVEFKQVVESVLEEEISIEDCTALILGQGIDCMLGDIVGFADATTLLASFQQLGSQAPAEVYRYVAETLRKGAAVQQRERMRQKLGFRRQMDS
jgi:hypothetical protein